MNSSIASGIVLLVFASAILIYGAVLYRGLARLRDQNNRLRASLDVLLKQRYEEIIELLASTRDTLPVEQTLLMDANDAVASATAIQQKAEADERLTYALLKFFESARKNPRLGSTESYRTLRKQLAGLQTQIADHRALFNEDVRAYNSRIGQFPDAVVAGILGMKRREKFEVRRTK
ncbi:MAG TPA: LemA family protein [Candidatus Sulfotelmatobacter sp.]|nr:LemA family protein [Candidatus Sulfotelmatobacter sp.]